MMNTTRVYPELYRLNRKMMGVDPASNMSRMLIFLYIKNLYNKDIR